LHKQDRLIRLDQNLVAELRYIAAAAERITKAHDCVDFLGQGNMTANPATHAFPDQYDLSTMLGADSGQGSLMSVDKLEKRIRTAAVSERVRIVHQLDTAHSA
jgi:hypothetical protein